MGVTELACLHIKNNLPIDHPSNEALFSKLKSGLEAQAKYTDSDAILLSQFEDPSQIYILGRWESVAQHMEVWIPSPTNQRIMGGLGEDIKLLWIQHLDLDPAKREDESPEGIPYSDSVIGIGRYFIASGVENRDEFERTFTETRHHLHNFKRPRKAVGGWRVDTDIDEEGHRKEEFVLFSGWAAVEEHFSFAESEGFKEFARIKDFMADAEIKHAKIVYTSR